MPDLPTSYPSLEAWQDFARTLFGEDMMDWRFVCPVCGHVATARDYKESGAPQSAVAFSCIGRWLESSREAFSKDDGPGPCNYAGGGLFRCNPVKIEGIDVQAFQFAPFAVAIPEPRNPSTP